MLMHPLFLVAARGRGRHLNVNSENLQYSRRPIGNAILPVSVEACRSRYVRDIASHLMSSQARPRRAAQSGRKCGRARLI